MKILAFGASYSKNSINKKLATYIANQFVNSEITILDLNDYQLPLYNIDLEKESGFPEIIHDFIKKIDSSDLLIISLAEHNGSYTAGFKNLFDWTSRVKTKMFEGKKLLLLSTSSGARGGLSVMQAAQTRFPIHGAEIIGHFSLPKFNENFDAALGIIDAELNKQLIEVLNTVKNQLDIRVIQ